MTRDPRPATASLFTQVEISPDSVGTRSTEVGLQHHEQTNLLRDILTAQDRQNELLEELVSVVGASQRQRNADLNQWKQANPVLARNCRKAAEALSRVQIEYLNRMTDDINEQSDDMVEGEFVLNEFVDRYGPRLAHLNGVIQVLAQLSSVPNPANTQS